MEHTAKQSGTRHGPGSSATLRPANKQSEDHHRRPSVGGGTPGKTTAPGSKPDRYQAPQSPARHVPPATGSHGAQVPRSGAGARSHPSATPEPKGGRSRDSQSQSQSQASVDMDEEEERDVTAMLVGNRPKPSGSVIPPTAKNIRAGPPTPNPSPSRATGGADGGKGGPEADEEEAEGEEGEEAEDEEDEEEEQANGTVPEGGIFHPSDAPTTSVTPDIVDPSDHRDAAAPMDASSSAAPAATDPPDARAQKPRATAGHKPRLSSKMRIDMARTNRARHSKEAGTRLARMASLCIPPSRAIRQIRRTSRQPRVTRGAGVYLAGVADYLVAEVLELAGNHVRARGKKTIKPVDVNLGARGDEELNRFLKGVTVPGGGTEFHIHKALVKDLVNGKRSRKRVTPKKVEDGSLSASSATDPAPPIVSASVSVSKRAHPRTAGKAPRNTFPPASAAPTPSLFDTV